jgi:hypothetical protein
MLLTKILMLHERSLFRAAFYLKFSRPFFYRYRWYFNIREWEIDRVHFRTCTADAHVSKNACGFLEFGITNCTGQ